MYWPVCIILLTLSANQIFTIPRTTTEVVSRIDTGSVIDTLPLSFVANVGQSPLDIRFTIRSLGGTLRFSPQEVVFNLNNVGSETKGLETLVPSFLLISHISLYFFWCLLLFCSSTAKATLTLNYQKTGKVLLRYR